MNVLRRDFVVREPLLVVILVLIAVVFSTVTHAYSRAYDRRRNQLGQQWYADGVAELQKDRPDTAVERFRTALLYDPRNWTYRLSLAEALTQAGRTKQAMNYYESLWQVNPKSGIVNLNLARLAARSGEFSETERYYNGAIFGDWAENASDHRREALFELIHFYLQRKDTSNAESQLIILSGNLPEDPALHTRVADLFSQVGDYPRALEQYRRAIQLDPKYFPALSGFGKASFRAGDYRSAEAYLSRAAREDSAGPEVRYLLDVTQAAAALNPFDRSLREADKIQRTLHAFRIASARLEACTKASGNPATLPAALASLQEPWKRWKIDANPSYLSRQPDRIESLFDFSAAVEKHSQSLCGPPTPEDTALLVLANARPSDEK